MNNIQEMYDRLSKIQDELTALCKETGSTFKSVRFDINVQPNKELVGWIWLNRPDGGDRLIPRDIRQEIDFIRATELAKSDINASSRASRIAELLTEIDKLKAMDNTSEQ